MEEQTKKCPFCGQEINALAIKCRFCGKWLDSNARNEGPEFASNPKLHQDEPQQQYTQQGPQQQYSQQGPQQQYTQQGPQQQYTQQAPPPPQYAGVQPPYQNIYVEQPTSSSNGLGTAGFVLALIGLVLGWVPILGWVLWFLGLLFSFIGIFKKPRGLAVAGLVISLIGIVLILLITGGFLNVLSEILSSM